MSTDSVAVLAAYLETLLKANQVTLNVADVFYSDQQRIPRTPTICVDPSSKTREIIGAPRRTKNVMEVYIILYFSRVIDVQVNSRDSDAMCDAVEAIVHADPTLGNLVIHSLVTHTEAGYRIREDTQFRAARLTVQAESQSMLPMNSNYNQ